MFENNSTLWQNKETFTVQFLKGKSFFLFLCKTIIRDRNPFQFVPVLFKELEKIMATLQDILSALDTNSRLTAQAADTSAQALVKVVEGFAALKEQLANLDITPEQLNDLQNTINANSDILQAVITTQGQISETAAQTAPTVQSPVDPVPPTEPTLPENPVELPAEISEEGVDVVESPENIGLPGSVEIDISNPETSEI